MKQIERKKKKTDNTGIIQYRNCHVSGFIQEKDLQCASVCNRERLKCIFQFKLIPNDTDVLGA